ncbi:hypothetical protein LIZ76_17295 [Caldibacillus sp. 210928-DFI.2.22]|nr:hypothetical protein [Caldibacillus sp. 210928-DFI.2.22]
MATRLNLVTILSRETPFFGDEPRSRRLFCAEISFFWRRNSFSSSFLCGNLPFLATSPVLVVILSRETPFFGDEPCSRRRFGVRKSCFWRRDLFSSSFLGQKVMFLATRPNLVVVLGEKVVFLATSPNLVAIFGQKTRFFGDETCSRRRFEPGNSLFWRRDLISSPF